MPTLLKINFYFKATPQKFCANAHCTHLPLLATTRCQTKSKVKRVQLPPLCSVSKIPVLHLGKIPIFEPSMKRVTAIFLLLLFLIANSGVAVSVHWCGGKLASIDLFSDGGHSCKCGKRAMKPNCCKDETVQLKANDELAKATQFTFKVALLKISFIPTKQIEVLPSAQYLYAASDFYHPPPFKPKAPIYLLDRVFLI